MPFLVALCAIALVASTAIAQVQFDELRKRHIPSDTAFGGAIAMGDLDNDGDLDVIRAPLGADIRIYFNDGLGIFEEDRSRRLPAGQERSWDLQLGDVDGDGDLELVVAYDGIQNRLYLNNGSGAFTDVTGTHMPQDKNQLVELALGDVDGDGDLDMALAIWGSHDLLYLNDGTGRFSDLSATHMPMETGVTSSVAIGDVDGDGDLDLVFGIMSTWTSYIRSRLYLNNGTGIFTRTSSTRLAAPPAATQDVVLGDIDGDGDLDLALGVIGNNQLLLNYGSVRDREPCTVRCVDGDGDADLVCGNFARQHAPDSTTMETCQP